MMENYINKLKEFNCIVMGLVTAKIAITNQDKCMGT